MNAIEKKHYRTEFISDHATITKDTAVGFAEWVADNAMTIGRNGEGKVWYKTGLHSKIYTFSELYDIYVKSLEG